MREVYLTNHHIISSLGFDSITNFNNLLEHKSGIKSHNLNYSKPFYCSLIDKERVNQVFSKIGDSTQYTVLEKMMIISVNQLLIDSKLKISNKTGIIISTTKGNVDVLSPKSDFFEDKDRSYLSELGKKVQSFFGFEDDAIVLSNACVSGVLALSVAKHLIQSKFYDDVVIVSGDLVSEFILSGFESFQAISSTPCKPYSKNRDGISIGEATASILVSSRVSEFSKNVVQILGSGSFNDANHISGPSRTGEGLYLSVLSAMNEANISEDQIDYISAHGTATNFNDEMEAIAFNRLKMEQIPLNSLKGYFGHTLGASGLIESIIGIESMHNNTLIMSMGFDELGTSKPLNIIERTTQKELKIFLKTASGFGGSNTAIILKKIL